MNMFRQDSNSFGWGILTGCIDTVGGDKYSILENSHLLTLEQVKKQATCTFSDITFDLALDVPDPMVMSDIDPAAGTIAHLAMFYRR